MTYGSTARGLLWYSSLLSGMLVKECCLAVSHLAAVACSFAEEAGVGGALDAGDVLEGAGQVSRCSCSLQHA